MNEYKKLKTLDAWGAIEGVEPTKTALGNQMFENFRDGRNLKRVTVEMEIIPWLFKSRFYSKRWNATWNVSPPFRDHVRYFVDADTKERIVTSQPYLLDVAHDTGEYSPQEYFTSEKVAIPREFYITFGEHFETRPFKPLPQTPLITETINAILEKAKKVSDEFASKHGLEAKVSFNGWYNPQQVVLIEYKKLQVQ